MYDLPNHDQTALFIRLCNNRSRFMEDKILVCRLGNLIFELSVETSSTLFTYFILTVARLFNHTFLALPLNITFQFNASYDYSYECSWLLKSV